MNSLDLLEKAYEHFINAKKFGISDEPLKQYSNLSAAHTLYMFFETANIDFTQNSH